MEQEQFSPDGKTEMKVPPWGYLALAVAMVFFSGLLGKVEIWKALDFNVVNGAFGTMKDAAKATFMGQGGAGAREGFLFAIGLVPAVMLALGIVEVADHLGALRAAQKMLTPLLRPLMGIPGIAGLALITSLQSTDAGAGMTKALRDSGMINEREKTIFAAFQFSSGGAITNFFSSGAALFGFLTVPTIAPLMVMFVMKVVGANVMRCTIGFLAKDLEDDDAQ